MRRWARGGRSGYALSGPRSRAATEHCRRHLINTASSGHRQRHREWVLRSHTRTPRRSGAKEFPRNTPRAQPQGGGWVRGRRTHSRCLWRWRALVVLMRHVWPGSVVARERGPENTGPAIALTRRSLHVRRQRLLRAERSLRPGILDTPSHRAPSFTGRAISRLRPLAPCANRSRGRRHPAPPHSVRPSANSPARSSRSAAARS
jgi:hypothetical protein